MSCSTKIGCVLALALTATMPGTAAAEPTWQLDTKHLSVDSTELSAVDVVASQTWVGGTKVNAQTGRIEPVVGLWDGTVLDRKPNPDTDPALDVRLSDLAVVGDDVLSVGDTTSPTGVTQPVISRYSRTQPEDSAVLPGPTVDAYGTLNAITPGATDRALVVGVTGPNPASTRTLILEQDQSGWHRIPSASPGTGTNQLNAVTAAHGRWAAGHYTWQDEPGRAHPLLLHDTGSGAGWTQVSVPDPGLGFTELTGIAVDGNGDVFVAGWTGPTNGDPEDRTAVAMRWNQHKWEVLNLESDGVTQFNDVTVAPDGRVLFAGYATVDSVEVANLEEWVGRQDLIPVAIVLPTPDIGVFSYPATGINAIDAGPAGAAPCAVGWIRPPAQSLTGATLSWAPIEY